MGVRKKPETGNRLSHLIAARLLRKSGIERSAKLVERNGSEHSAFYDAADEEEHHWDCRNRVTIRRPHNGGHIDTCADYSAGKFLEELLDDREMVSTWAVPVGVEQDEDRCLGGENHRVESLVVDVDE